MDNTELMNEGIDTVVYELPTVKVVDNNKLLIGAIGFATGVLAAKVVVPGIRKLKESIDRKRHFKDLENDDILDESEVEFVDEK